MHRCIQLAMNGKLNAQPNPMVGAVIVSEDGRIIGEGYHVRCGEGHAEVNAFASVKQEDMPLLSKSTLYVSLEPCSHYGKTPPCADLIIQKGVQKVVIGTIDPFAKVQGRGIQKLRDAGIQVKVGVCEQECNELNKVFFTFHSKHRPFITLKWAQTNNGIIGIIPDDKHKDTAICRLIISNDTTRAICHKRRAEHQAILVGRKTWELDCPSLNVRDWTGKDPQKVILGNGTTIEKVIEELYNNHIQSVLVEGGRETLQSFIDAGLWDEAYVEIGNKTYETQENQTIIKAPVISEFISQTETHFNGNTIIKYKH